MAKFDPKKFLKYKFKVSKELEHILKGKPQKVPSIPQKSKIRPFIGIFRLVVIAFLIAIIIRTFFVQIFVIPSNSMQPTLEAGDRVMINKISYGLANPFWGAYDTKKMLWIFNNPFYGRLSSISKERHFLKLNHDPKRMDIIVFRSPAIKGEEKINMAKRIVGLPGEQIKIRNGKVYINGKLVEESHAMLKDNFNYGPVKIPHGSYFVLGDNRSSSSDSRSWGSLPANDIVGIVSIRIWPLNNSGAVK